MQEVNKYMENIQHIATSITHFLIITEPNKNNTSTIDLYNQWSYDTDAQLNDFAASKWALNFLASARQVDKQLLREALRIDSDQQRNV